MDLNGRRKGIEGRDSSLGKGAGGTQTLPRQVAGVTVFVDFTILCAKHAVKNSACPFGSMSCSINTFCINTLSCDTLAIIKNKQA